MAVVFAMEESPMRDAVHYKLMGFSANGSVRRFIFKKGGDPMAPPFTVIADVALARKLKVPLQDLPSLCARLLEADREDESSRTIRVTASDLSLVAATNAAATQQLAEKRAGRTNAGKTAGKAAQEGSDATLAAR